MFHFKTFVFLILVCFEINLSAQETQQEGFQVDLNTLDQYGMDTLVHLPAGIDPGNMAPDFTSNDQFGKAVNLYEMLEQGPVVLVFYRGVWCSICNVHLKKLEQNLNEIKAQGGQVLAVTPESSKGILGTIQKTHATFPILSDTLGDILHLYDVAFEVTTKYQERIGSKSGISIAENNHQEKAILPVPATFIIDQNKVVIFSHFDPDYKNRADIEEIVEVLKNMRS